MKKPEKFRKNLENRENAEFWKTGFQNGHGRVSATGQSRVVDEGALPRSKSVKNDILFCACGSKIQNDEKLSKSMDQLRDRPLRIMNLRLPPGRILDLESYSDSRSSSCSVVASWSARLHAGRETCEILSPHQLRATSEGRLVSFVSE